MDSIYQQIAELIKNGKSAALCTITKTEGSTPRKAGSKMLVYKTGEIQGSIGGGALEKECIKNALEVLKSSQAQVFKHKLEKDHAMSCGGVVEIFIEPLNVQKKLYIFGGGHIGKALSEFSEKLQFQVTVIDSRNEIFAHYTNTNVKTLNLSIEKAFETLEFDENVFICSIMHEHGLDKELIASALKRKFAYLGMIGSSRKIAQTQQFLLEKGFAQAEIEKINMPMGLSINCETPEEIAISILAKLIDVRTQN